jgi:hypothetical protein
MSHFTVVVIGNDIDEQLAPYAEQDFEPQYGEFQDKEDEYKNEYENEEVEIVVLADGSLHSKYAKQFQDNKSWSNNYVYPSDSTIRKGKHSELYPTFEDYMREWHGSDERDEVKDRYGYWHNPNAKWDWYSVGGRWTGYFKPKDGTVGELGESGAFGNKPKEGWVDSIRLCDIDFDGMKAEAIKEANETYDKLEEVLKGRPLPSWNAIREKNNNDIDAARAEYHGLKVVQDLNKDGFHIMGDYVETFGRSREEYVAKKTNAVAVPYAVVKDGKWYQKGEMGWFGMSNDELTQDQWNEQFWKMLEELDPETVLTLVDCHI